MSYEAVPQAPNPLGFAYNRGGLNNQKLALFGLFLKAFREGPRQIVLPDLLLFDQVSFNHVPVPIDRGVRLDPLREFAARHDVEILDLPARGDEGGWDYFHYGNNYIPYAALTNELAPDSFVCDFFRSLQSNIDASAQLRKVAHAVFKESGVGVVAQLRIENDWHSHTAHRLTPFAAPSEDNNPSFTDIIGKIKRTIDDADAIYVVCDEAALPVGKSEIRAAIKSEFGIDLFWKSDFLNADELDEMSLLDLSSLDFEMAVAAESFVGLTRSTFSNLVSLEKYVRTRAPAKRHFVYNIAGAKLELRTDNGAFSVPTLATATDVWASAHSFDLAEVFRAAGNNHRALERYAACASVSGQETELAFLSLYRAAQIKAQLGFSPADVVDTFVRATDALPSRAEAVHGASRHCREHNMFERGFELAAGAIDVPTPADGRFVEAWIYEWAMLDEYAVSAYWSGHYVESARACIELLSRSTLPDSHRARIASNAKLSLEKLWERARP
jgi:hypothetical protein